MTYARYFQVLCTFPNCGRYDCKEHRYINKKIAPYKPRKCKDCGTSIGKMSVRCRKDQIIHKRELRGIKKNPFASREVRELLEKINYRITEKA